MSSGSFDISQEGVDEMVYQLPLVVRNCSCLALTSIAAQTGAYQLPLVVRNCSCSQLRESERTELLATTTSSNKEVIQQDNDCHNDEDMN